MNRPVLYLSLFLPICAWTQEKKEAAEEEREPIEAEFVASDIFRSGTLLLPVYRKLVFEGYYFGGTETDTGFTGFSWVFGRKGLKIAPGFGAVFGSNEFTASPAVSVRWEFERKWFITQGMAIQSFRKTPIFEEEEEGEGESENGPREPVGYVRPTISDGNHVSARWKRLTIGGTWEHIAFREGDEWKGGGRLAFEILPRVSAILYVLTPGRTEWRGGILIHSRREED